MGYYRVDFKTRSVCHERVDRGSRDRVAEGAILVIVLAVVLLPLALLTGGTKFLSSVVRGFRHQHDLYAMVWPNQMTWLAGLLLSGRYSAELLTREVVADLDLRLLRRSTG